MKKQFGIYYHFTTRNRDEPPRVFIATCDGWGTSKIEVLEEPTLNNGTWEPGPVALQLLGFMNSEGFVL